MGSYYSGMMNNEFGYGELRHHGILGQKWGVRRFQNKDGSLTPAGRERYYGKEGQKEVDTLLKKYLSNREVNTRKKMLNKIKTLPQVEDAAKRILPEVEQMVEIQDAHKKAVDSARDNLYNNPKLYEKYLNKTVDNFMKRNKGTPLSRNKLYEWIKNNEDEMDEASVFETYLAEANDSFVHKCDQTYKDYNEKYKAYKNKLDEIVNSELYSNGDSFKKSILKGCVLDAAKDEIKRTTMPQDSKTMEKKFKQYKLYTGIYSLAYGDHRNDQGRKILDEAYNELLREKKSIRKALDKVDDDSFKDEYKRQVGQIVGKYYERYAEAVLKDMGYRPSESSVNWLMNQWWFIADTGIGPDDFY